jgi:HSP20 family protein
MAITRWDPFRELELVSNRLNRMLGSPGLSAGTFSGDFAWSPSADLSETAEEYVVKADLPGVRKEDMKVSIDRGLLTISGSRKEEKEEKNKRYHCVERSQGNFMRSFALPDPVDEAKLSAEFKQGLLTVRLPKTTPQKAQPVDIKVA